MGRRNDIDWEAVERLYIANKLTIRQIADECGISASTLKDKAKTLNWQRDLSSAIEARTKAKIAAIDVAELVEQSAQESAQQSAQTIKQAIEEASDIAAGVIRRHRKSIKETEDRVIKFEAKVDKHLIGVTDKVSDVVALTGALKQLADVRKSLILMERQAYNLDEPQKEDSPLAKVPSGKLRALLEQVDESAPE